MHDLWPLEPEPTWPSLRIRHLKLNSHVLRSRNCSHMFFVFVFDATHPTLLMRVFVTLHISRPEGLEAKRSPAYHSVTRSLSSSQAKEADRAYAAKRLSGRKDLDFAVSACHESYSGGATSVRCDRNQVDMSSFVIRLNWDRWCGFWFAALRSGFKVRTASPAAGGSVRSLNLDREGIFWLLGLDVFWVLS